LACNGKKKKKNDVQDGKILKEATAKNFFIVMIEFKPMASAHDGCSYHQAKTPIDFWCRRDLNPGLLLDNKRLYQLS
jgi:hypothetical protein